MDYNDNITSSNRVQNLPVFKLKPGMKLAENVKSEYGGLLLIAGTILDENKIDYIRKNNVKKATVELQFDDERKANLEKIRKIKRIYKNNVNETRILFNNARQLRKIDDKRLLNISNQINDLLEEDESRRELIFLFNRMQNSSSYIYHHSIDVGILAGMFADWLGLEKNEKQQLILAGYMHDIGKTRIPHSLLRKESSLTDNEFEKIKNHVIAGYKLLDDCSITKTKAAAGVLTHHERCDGSGYLGFEDNEIPLFGKILAICDVYDAATSVTVYNENKSPFSVIKYLTKDKASAFDLHLCQVFRDRMRSFYRDLKVELSNGYIGKIVFINPRLPSKPIVEVYGELIDLHESELEIEKIISREA